MLYWGRGYVSKGNKKIIVVFKINKDQFDWGDLLKILATDVKGKQQQQTTRQVTYMLTPLPGDRDMKNLVGYRIFMIYYYMPSFYMAWMTVWLYGLNKLIKLTNAFTYSIIKQKHL